VPGAVAISRGLENVFVDETAICFIDGVRGRLLYCGWDIVDLAARSTFEETAFILWHRRLPRKAELEELRRQLAENRPIPPEVLDLIKSLPRTAHPMDVLRTAVSALATYDPEVTQNSPDANLRKAIRLTAKLPTITAAYHRLRQGLAVVKPDPRRGLAEDFLRMLLGRDPDDLLGRIIDVCGILHAEHGMNASTFGAVVTASTLSDLYSSVVAAIGALKGPLHGGANEEVMKMLLEVKTAEAADEYVVNALAAKRKLSGFGHRVYKSYDPRATILKDYARRLSEHRGDVTLFETAEAVEKAMIREVGPKGIYPNVDFYSGIVYHLMGIPHDLFTPIFAVARITGWTAHVLEYWEDNRIMRPLDLYNGPQSAEYTPIEKR
jgi:citrate synthase